MRSTDTGRLWLGLSLLTCLVCLDAWAQRPGPIFQPDTDLAAGSGAHMLDENPAGVGFGGPLELNYGFTMLEGAQAGEGHTLSVGLGIWRYRSALGVQMHEAPGSDPVQLSWAHALGGQRLSLGVAWHTFIADDDPLLDGLSTWDLGLQMRPWRWLALGATVRDFTTPKLDGVPVERSYRLGVAVRPGTEALTVGAAVALHETDDPVATWSGTLAWRVVGPLSMVGRFEHDAEGGRRYLLGLSTGGGVDVGFYGAGAEDDLGAQGFGGAATLRMRQGLKTPPRLTRTPRVVELAVGQGAEYGARGWFSSESVTPFLDGLMKMRALARRDDVDGVLLTFGRANFGWAQAAELRAGIADLRAAGKRVFVYLTTADTRTYAVAAAADEIYLAPAGGLLLTGVRYSAIYLAEGLSKLGVKAQFVAVGEYKSAPEMFTNTGPSEASSRVHKGLVDDLFKRTVAAIAAGRGRSREEVVRLVDEGPYTAKQALAAKLVNGIAHYDELEAVMREAFGRAVGFVEADALLAGRDERWGRSAEVAVLYVVGNITDGASVVSPFSGAASVGADTIVAAAQALREDSDVAAVVLRIDSPGGSVTAADAMWRALDRLAKAKPLYVSMGDVAASGGYYVAAPGRRIYAMPETITGSIGIFTGKFDITGLFDLLGVGRRTWSRGARANLLSMDALWTDEERALVQTAMETMYALFLDRILAGRDGLDRAALDKVGRGRVWTGGQAQARGLVDVSGGLLDAIDAAAEAAALDPDDYHVRAYPPVGVFGQGPSSPVGQLMSGSPDLMASVLRMVGAERSEWTALSVVLRRLPIFAFKSGEALALLPYVLTFD